jgi:hypothetical protein
MGITEHQVATCETNGDLGSAIITMKVQDAGHAEGTADDRHAVVVRTNGEGSPQIEVVLLSQIVERVSRTSVEEDERTLGRRQLHRQEHTIQNEDRSREYVGHGGTTESD